MTDYTTLPEMPDEDIPYAVASHISYEFYYDKDPFLTQDKLTSMMDTFSLDTELSNDVGVVLRRDDNSAILAYRGTDPTNIYDLNADAQLATGLDRLLPFQTRLQRAEDLYNSVKNVYPNVELTGHSLGGYLADHISRENNEKAVIFNPGLTPITTHTLPPMGAFKTIVYELDNFDSLSHSVHNRVYSSEVDLRTITQRENLTEWVGSHNIDSFLPKSRHIVKENDTLQFPKFKPHFGKPVERPQPRTSVNTSLNICKNEPDLIFCKKKVKLNKKVSRLR
tara:strand:- start:44 stop:883 length:840 start_codon:yes stop_codon:yes gene_type:complete